MLYERIASALVATPLQHPAEQVRSLVSNLKRLRHPELRHVLCEGPRSRALMQAVIHDGMNCIDAGAHLGTMTHEMVRLSPSGHHYAFEPIPYKAAWLREKFPSVEVRQAALSDSAGKATFWIAGRSTAVSALHIIDEQSGERSIEVDCVRLDDVIAPHRRIGFIKMDVIGAEYAVMRGAQALLARDRPVLLFECTQTGSNAFNVDPAEQFEFLTRGFDYTLYSLKGWAMREPALDLSRFLEAMVYPFEAFNFVALPKPN